MPNILSIIKKRGPIRHETGLPPIDCKEGGVFVPQTDRRLSLDGAGLTLSQFLEAVPLCCTLWLPEGRPAACNRETLCLFGLREEQAYLEGFFSLSPKYQPDGRPSLEKFLEKLSQALQLGRCVFEWMHRLPGGEAIPTEVTLIRLSCGSLPLAAAYTRDLRELKRTLKLRDRLEQMAHFDSLTGVLSRAYFLERTDQLLRADPDSARTSLMLLDLDHFKEVNDTFGHTAGDQVLYQVASAVARCLTSSQLFGRYGGEEFLILSPQRSRVQLMQQARRILGRVAGLRVPVKGGHAVITVSIGIAMREDPAKDFDLMLREADQALYRAKALGRNRAEFYAG